MRILVTGGAGFIGSHLCERLLAGGHEVVCLDNFFTGRRENVYQLMGSNRFELLRHDIIEPILLEVDQIYNLACPASPIHYQYNPVKTVKTSVMGTINMLGLAKRVHARILQASTSEVYGDPEIHPQPEDYWGHVNCVGLRSCYDEGKRIAETLMMDYHRQNKVDTRIIRIFNTYGPRMLENDGRVVSNFIVQSLRGEELTIYGTGEQTRSFCYVDDLVEGMIRLMNVERGASEEYDVHDPVNVGNPGEFTMRELAEEVALAVGREPRTRTCPLPQDDPKQRRPDITRARKLLGWEPTVQLREGLKRTVEYFAERIGKTVTSDE
jgi:UDP-glucuronate decarboxylase